MIPLAKLKNDRYSLPTMKYLIYSFKETNLSHSFMKTKLIMKLLKLKFKRDLVT